MVVRGKIRIIGIIRFLWPDIDMIIGMNQHNTSEPICNFAIVQMCKRTKLCQIRANVALFFMKRKKKVRNNRVIDSRKRRKN